MKYEPLTKDTIEMLKSLDDSSYIAPTPTDEGYKAAEKMELKIEQKDYKPSPLPKPAKGIRQKVCRSSEGHWREINPELLLELAKGGFTASELQVIIYALWSISSDKERNYINVKRRTIQERTNLSKGQVHKVIHSLIDKNVIIKTEESDSIYIFNATVSTWIR